MKFLEINATDITSGIIAHGVNRRLAMGSGIAGALANKWPVVRNQYLTRKDPVPDLGSVDLVAIPFPLLRPGVGTGQMYSETTNQLYVANCYTQDNFGGDGKRYADSDAVFEAAVRLLLIGGSLNLPVYIPPIGCGLGGLDWELDVRDALLCAEKYYKDTLVSYELWTPPEFTVIDMPGSELIKKEVSRATGS